MPIPYEIRLAGKSALRLNARRTFKWPEYKAVVMDALNKFEQSEPPHHIGLLVTVYLQADDIFGAIRQSFPIAERIFNTLSLAYCTAIEDPQLLFALEATPGSVDREIAQVIHSNRDLFETRRAFADDLFRPIHKLLDAARVIDSKRQPKQQVMKRIDRALRYLRKSYLEIDPLDRFEDLAAGLQSIDPLIRERFNLRTTLPTTCSSCKEPLYCRACKKKVLGSDNWAGTYYVLTKVIKRSEAEAHKIRIRRNDIAHASKEIEELEDGIADLSSLGNNALIAGILTLLDASDTYIQSVIRRPLPLFRPPDFLVTFRIRNLPLENIVSRGTYPLLTLKAIEISSRAATAEARTITDVFGIALNLEATFTEDWEAGSASYYTLGKASEDLAPSPRVIIQKLKRVVFGRNMLGPERP